MKQYCDEAYVLKTLRLGEADLIVTLLSRSHGQVRGVARSAMKSRRRFGGALEALTRVRASWAEKPGRELQHIEALECRRSFAAMQAEPDLQAACACLAEVAEAFSREGEPGDKSFDLLGAVLEALEGGLAVPAALRYFEYWTLRLHGLLPDLERCASCARDFASGEAPRIAPSGTPLCAGCAGATAQPSLALGAQEQEFLRAAARRAPDQLGEAASRIRGGGSLERLLRGTLESFVERKFKTYRHLRSTIGTQVSGRSG